MRHLFEMENLGTTLVHNNTVEGQCFGYTMDWIYRMSVKKDQPKLTQPSVATAGVLQTKADQMTEQRNETWEQAVRVLAGVKTLRVLQVQKAMNHFIGAAPTHNGRALKRAFQPHAELFHARFWLFLEKRPLDSEDL